MDLTLILQGPEACGKSSALEALAGVEWFSDSPLPLGHPGDLVEALGSAWVHELPELDGIRKRQVTQVKAFLTATSDRGRPAYGRNIVEAPRRCVFAGSTNEAAFLPSDTGNRRFWVIPVRKSIDVAWITSNRAALWAEAVHHFKTDGKWWFGREIEAHLDAQCTSLFREADPFEEPIEDYLESHPGPLLLADILNLVGTSRNKRQEADRVTRILRQRGYERPKSSWWHGGRKARWWRGP